MQSPRDDIPAGGARACLRIDMTELAQILNQYFASRNLAAAWPDGGGALTFRTEDGLTLVASLSDTGGLVLRANPGYLDATQLETMFDDTEDVDGEDAGLLERWNESGVAWRLDADRSTGRVALSRFSPELPRDADGFATAVESMRAVFVEWSAQLEPPAHWMPQAISFSLAHSSRV
jgi:hypothetical protein